jgi:arginase
MTSNNKTLRLTFPQWQGGHKEIFSLGSSILKFLAPKNEEDISMEVPLYGDYADTNVSSVLYQEAIVKQLEESAKIIEDEEPEKLIVFGGDCLVAQTPLDYLNGQYENLGVLWFDAHPDISTPKQTDEGHAMVLGNLLGEGAEDLAASVQNPFDPSQFMYLGLVEEKMSDFEREAVNKHQINTINSSEIKNAQASQEKINVWIEENNFSHIAVFFDLDVLSPKEFRSIMPAEPYLENFEPAIGSMKFKQISNIVNGIDREMVSLIMTEYMPWDANNLQKFMKDMSIFE